MEEKAATNWLSMLQRRTWALLLPIGFCCKGIRSQVGLFSGVTISPEMTPLLPTRRVDYT